jgi:hypothetical protein
MHVLYAKWMIKHVGCPGTDLICSTWRLTPPKSLRDRSLLVPVPQKLIAALGWFWNVMKLPGLVSTYKKRWKDPPCYQCENPLFRLGQGFKFANCWHNQRVLHLGFSINSSSIHHVSAPVRILVIADTFWKASYYTFWAIGSLVTLARVQSYPQWSWHEFQGNTAYSIYLSLSFFSILLVLLCMYIYI